MMSIKEFPPLDHSFHMASSWHPVGYSSLPPMLWFFPWPLGSSESFSVCRQFPGILLAQKWVRFVLVALFVQTLRLLFFLLTQTQESILNAPPHTTHTFSIPTTPFHSYLRKTTRPTRTQGFTRIDLPHFHAQG